MMTKKRIKQMTIEVPREDEHSLLTLRMLMLTLAEQTSLKLPTQTKMKRPDKKKKKIKKRVWVF